MFLEVLLFMVTVCAWLALRVGGGSVGSLLPNVVVVVGELLLNDGTNTLTNLYKEFCYIISS